MVKKLLPIFLLLLAPSLLAADSTRASNFSSAKSKDRANDAEIQALRASLQAKLNELHKAASFPGATLGFVLPDGRSGSVSVGLADAENKIALKPTDRMLAGSIGKTYVSAVMLQAVQEGKLNLDTKIDRWFESDAWFPHLPNAKDITVRMVRDGILSAAQDSGGGSVQHRRWARVEERTASLHRRCDANNRG